MSEFTYKQEIVDGVKVVTITKETGHKSITPEEKYMYTSKDVIGSLETLGFNDNQINYVVDNMETKGNSLEKLIEDAIKMISNAGKSAFNYTREEVK